MIELSNNIHFDELFSGAKPGEVYVDVGTFDGDTIRWALIHQPKLRVIGIEPVQELAQAIANSNPAVTMVCAVASNRDGFMKLHRFKAPYQGITTVEGYMKDVHSHLESEEVDAPCRRLDTVLLELGIGSVDYIKVDTEGHEEEVLQGFSLYHPGTRFHIEYHVHNLAGILYQLKMMNVEITKITLAKDPVKQDVTVGFVLGVAR